MVKHNELTPREKQIKALRDQGLSQKKVSQELGLSIGTVKLHCRHIDLKTYLNNPPPDSEHAQRQLIIPDESYPDKSLLTLEISISDNRVRVDFGLAVSYIAMQPLQANLFADIIRTKANELLRAIEFANQAKSESFQPADQDSTT